MTPTMMIDNLCILISDDGRLTGRYANTAVYGDWCNQSLPDWEPLMQVAPLSWSCACLYGVR